MGAVGKATKSLSRYTGNLTYAVTINPLICGFKVLGAVFGRRVNKKEEVDEFENYVAGPPLIENCPYRIDIPQKTWLKMAYTVKNCPTEVGGHLEVEKDGDRILLKELHIPQQKVDGSTYDPSSNQFAQIAKTNPQLLSRIKGWFHSHVNFGTFWSGDDEETITNSLEVFGDYCVSIVMNKEYEYNIRLDVKEGDEVKSYENLPLHILVHKDEVIESRCVDELKAKVKRGGVVGVLNNIKNACGI